MGSEFVVAIVISSMIKTEGNLLEFVSRPIAASLAAATVLVWFAPIAVRRLRAGRAGLSTG